MSTNYDFSRINGERISEIEELIKGMLEKKSNIMIGLDKIWERISQLEEKQKTNQQNPQIQSSKNKDRKIHHLTIVKMNIKTVSLLLLISLNDAYLGRKTLKDINGINEEEFDEFWLDEYMNVFIIFFKYAL